MRLSLVANSNQNSFSGDLFAFVFLSNLRFCFSYYFQRRVLTIDNECRSFCKQINLFCLVSVQSFGLSSICFHYSTCFTRKKLYTFGHSTLNFAGRMKFAMKMLLLFWTQSTRFLGASRFIVYSNFIHKLLLLNSVFFCCEKWKRFVYILKAFCLNVCLNIEGLSVDVFSYQIYCPLYSFQ